MNNFEQELQALLKKHPAVKSVSYEITKIITANMPMTGYMSVIPPINNPAPISDVPPPRAEGELFPGFNPDTNPDDVINNLKKRANIVTIQN